MKRRSFLWSLVGLCMGTLGLQHMSSQARRTREADEDLVIVNGWIVKRSQLPEPDSNSNA